MVYSYLKTFPIGEDRTTGKRDSISSIPTSIPQLSRSEGDLYSKGDPLTGQERHWLYEKRGHFRPGRIVLRTGARLFLLSLE